jgi:hypothetical protein
MKMMTFAEYVRLHKFTPRLYFSRGWESSRTWSELEQKMDPDLFSEGIARALWRNYEQTVMINDTTRWTPRIRAPQPRERGNDNTI